MSLQIAKPHVLKQEYNGYTISTWSNRAGKGAYRISQAGKVLCSFLCDLPLEAEEVLEYAKHRFKW